MTPASEYGEVRREILQWQQLRIVVLGAVMAAVTVTLTRAPDTRAPDNYWPITSTLLLFIVLVAQLFTLYAARGNAMLSTYIEVFHESNEPGWETRRSEFKKDFVSGYFNKLLALVYVLLGVASVGVPVTRYGLPSRDSNDSYRVILMAILACLALLSLYVAVWEWCRRPARCVFVAEWRRIKEGHEEARAAGTTTRRYIGVASLVITLLSTSAVVSTISLSFDRFTAGVLGLVVVSLVSFLLSLAAFRGGPPEGSKPVSDEEVRRRAFAIWKRRTYRSEQDDWYQAERELRRHGK